MSDDQKARYMAEQKLQQLQAKEEEREAQEAETKTRTHGMRLHNELNTMLRRYVRHVPDAWILTQTHDELRQRRDAFKNPIVFALAVIRVSWRRSLQLNRRVSMGMVRSSIRTLSSGAVKTALGLPIVMPTE